MDGVTAAAETSLKPDNRVQRWLGDIAAARKREANYRKEGKRVLDIYNGKKKDSIPFNILYSNTETLLPALHNATPRPVVQRRFKDEDPLGKVASTAGARTLEFLVDTNSEEYEAFDDVLSDAVLDALLPGRGVSRVKYDADIQGEAGSRHVKWELVCFESQKWDRVVFGYAKKWSRCPWIAFEHDVTLEEATELFTAEKAAKLQFSEEARLEDRADTDSDDDEEQRTGETRKVAKVWEVWHKSKKQVLYISPNYQDDFLKIEDDPLELTGFYPIPKPLRFLRKSNDQMPTAIYALYENQAKELNRLSVRINRIAEALKVRGAYDSTLGEIANILKADDNTMVAADNVAALMDKGGLEKSIWLMPIDKLVNVFQQLIIARTQCKQIIYEITGISDILRGSTVASETATAQQIKNQWGTLRLKRLQKEVATYARDMLRIALEIAVKKFSEKTFASITGLPFATQPEVAAAKQQIEAAKPMVQQKLQAAQMGGQQLPSEAPQQMLMQAVPEAFKTLQKPQWEAILKMLRSDTQRMFRIDVETNSTVDVEATEDQKVMGEVLQAISQFMQGVAPMIQSGSMPFQVAQSMLLAIVRRYRFGPEIEDYLKQMGPPQPPKDPKVDAELQMKQMEGQQKQEEHQRKMAEMDAKMQNEREMADMKMEVEREKLANEKEKMRLEREKMIAEHQVTLAELDAKVRAAHAMPKKPAKGGDRASA